MANFELVEESVPARTGRAKNREYKEMLEAIYESGYSQGKIKSDKKPSTLYLSLKRAQKEDERFSVLSITQRTKHFEDGTSEASVYFSRDDI